MTTLPNTGMTLPVRGAGGAGAWGDTLDADLQIIDVMDHTPGHGPRVPTAGLNINADLPFSALWAPTQLHRVQFSAIASGGLTAGQRKSLFVSDGTGGTVANELYYFTSAGATIQITTGSALNVGAFVGGIGGDYSNVGATLNYTDAAKGYEFKESTADSHGWARLRSGDLRLLPFNTTSAFFVAQAADPALATSYTMTWPTALPASKSVLSVDNTGQIASDATGLAAAAFSGLITASAGLTAGANQHVTVSGTGEFKHGDRVMQIPGAAVGPGTSIASAGTGECQISGNTTAVFPIILHVGDRIKSLTFAALGDGAVDLSCDVIKKFAVNPGTSSSINTGGTSVTVTNVSAAAWGDTVVDTVDTTTALGEQYVLRIVVTGWSSLLAITNVRVTYDHP